MINKGSMYSSQYFSKKSRDQNIKSLDVLKPVNNKLNCILKTEQESCEYKLLQGTSETIEFGFKTFFMPGSYNSWIYQGAVKNEDNEYSRICCLHQLAELLRSCN